MSCTSSHVDRIVEKLLGHCANRAGKSHKQQLTKSGDTKANTKRVNASSERSDNVGQELLSD